MTKYENFPLTLYRAALCSLRWGIDVCPVISTSSIEWTMFGSIPLQLRFLRGVSHKVSHEVLTTKRSEPKLQYLAWANFAFFEFGKHTWREVGGQNRISPLSHIRCGLRNVLSWSWLCRSDARWVGSSETFVLRFLKCWQFSSAISKVECMVMMDTTLCSFLLRNTPLA